jgi:betaine-aldehyde dehydrogenase
VFVHDSIHDAFCAKLLERTKLLTIGEPMNEETEIGPMINEKHMKKVLEYIRIGKEEDGAKLLYGGERLTEGKLAKGYYLSPAIFTDCTDSMTIVKEEVFGMVMSVLKFTDEEEVITRANATDFGLSAGVFTKDIMRAHRVVAKIKAGTTWINNYNLGMYISNGFRSS